MQKVSQSEHIYCRWAPSLGDLEGTAEDVWGTKPYKPEKHINEPMVAFGLYGLPDFYDLWRHKGKKYIFWAGSDILHFRKGYWLDDTGEIHFDFQGGADLLGSQPFARWINNNCESWVENEGEAWQLKDCGIRVDGITPSFMGRIKDYKVCFRPGNKVYASANEGSQYEYGWGIIQQIACQVPEIEFHLYGASWPSQPVSNIIVHGRVPKEQMNGEIKKMQCGLRLNKHDGFSEVTAKSVLWGQYPITYLYHPHIQQYVCGDDCGQPYCVYGLQRLVKMLKKVPTYKKPNREARAYYVKTLNSFPWNQKR